MPDGVAWRCPKCHGRLDAGRDRWACRGCGRGFRALRGIPDLRTRDDLYLPNDEDWSVALRLNAAYDRLDFLGLLDRYFELEGSIPDDLKRRQTAHILSAPGRARRWREAIGETGTGPLLDLGCGSGSFLLEIGRDGGSACGVDVAMRWLLVARKRLDGAGLGRVALACACAEDLPVGDAAFAGVVAGDVIEHVAGQAATLAEAYRVLRPGGRVFLASPNRYSLAPEPHVQVWGVGFLPRRWMSAYVRLARGLDFRAVRTMGYREWGRLLRSSPFGGGRVTVPPLPPDDLAGFGRLKRRAALGYNATVATAPGRLAARAFGPLFHVVCEKPRATSPTRAATRATRPRSRRPAART
jgi:SAM-dependent methyltransferase